MTLPLVIGRCPVCGKQLGIQMTMLPGSLLVCVSCDSHLRVESLQPVKLVQVDAAESRTEDARPEAYG